jgi:ComF family protein
MRTAVGWLRQFAGSAANLVFPPQCAACLREFEVAGDVLLCAACRELLVDESRAPCPRCAAPLPKHLHEPKNCPHCRNEKFAFSRVVALGTYEGSLQEAVLRMKQPLAEPLAIALAKLLADRIAANRSEPFDFAAPIPMHWTRRIARGYNCPDLLAETIARRLRIPFFADALSLRNLRSRQHTLTPAERRRNMRVAFRVGRRYVLNEARVLLVDDALTTGATANAASLALKKSGAVETTVAVIARGVGSR